MIDNNFVTTMENLNVVKVDGVDSLRRAIEGNVKVVTDLLQEDDEEDVEDTELLFG